MFSERSRLWLLTALMSIVLISPVGARQHNHHRSRAHERYVNIGLTSVAPVIQCVAFAKQDAGIDISGNARDWWSNAAGVYARGSRPENGSVLSFQENGRMPLGHVAVVSGIKDTRTIMIDQSHWNSRGVARGVVVEDVSQDNDWTAVRVQLGRGAGFGNIYLTHGFIYPRPDESAALSEVTYNALRPTSRIVTKSRSSRARHNRVVTELAEASSTLKALDLTIRDPSNYAPSRSSR